MPIPPILEIYVVWHPDDDPTGARIAAWLVDHFHGSAYSGLAGGAVEVYIRSAPWIGPGKAPRPLPVMKSLPADLPSPQFIAVVPILGTGLARAVTTDPSWRQYVQTLFQYGMGDRFEDRHGDKVAVFPMRDPDAFLEGTDLAVVAKRPQTLPERAAGQPAILARELAQAIIQRLLLTADEPAVSAAARTPHRMTVFVSHTKHHTQAENQDGAALMEHVRTVLRKTHLGEFFDAHDIQVGSDWEKVLDQEAGRCALLMVRTDQYASREWTQREVWTAKSRDLPIVGLYAVRGEEERGSFLMDHIPVIPCESGDPEPAIERALNRLVDEALKRVLWQQQTVYLRQDGFDWLPGHAPEPVTLIKWLVEHRLEVGEDPHIWILHPDPPLGPREHEVITDLCALAGFDKNVDVLTPRVFASRGGRRNR